MSRFVRQIEIRVNGSLKSGEIGMSSPREGTNGRWTCMCSISFLLDEPMGIHGEDAFEALSHGLLFLGGLIRGSENDGWVLWWQQENDHCGFGGESEQA